MFRRPFRRAIMRAANPAILEAVTRANELLANGKPAAAAEIYSRLAQGGDDRARPRLAANMHAHAAHAYAQAKNESAALAHARSGMAEFSNLGMAQRVSQFFANITRKLRENGLNGAADTLQKEFGDKVNGAGASDIASGTRRGRLPGKCPHCAGPARSDEVDWIDENSAECNYCGGIIQTAG